MKKVLLSIISSSLFLISFAQNCPSTATYTVNSGNTVSNTYNLENDKSIAVKNNSVLNATIENAFSSGAGICVTNGSTLNLSFRNVNTMQAGGFIYVDATSTVNFTGDNVNAFPLTIINYGTVTQSNNIAFVNGASITNYGTYTISGNFMLNSGTVILNNNSTFNFAGQTTFNSGSFEITNQKNSTINFAQNLNQANTTLTNYGTINYYGEANVQSNSTIYNSGFLYFENTGDNSMHFSGVSFTNKGVVSVKGRTLINSGSTLYNKCTWKDYKQFYNDGSIQNDGNIFLDVTSTNAVFKNQGGFVNGANGFVQGYDFYNVGGSITGGGNFYFSNFTQNQVSFSGTGTSINFYDASQSAGKIFDQQNAAPDNTTRFYVTPNTSQTIPTLCDATLMPMSIVSFTAIASGNKAILTWSIVNEIDVDNYSIERSTNGTDFKAISKTAGVNRTAYTYTISDDLNAVTATGKVYYRIVQTSKNGDIFYTDIIPVNYNHMAVANKLTISPNPATSYITLSVNSTVAGASTIRIFSQSGQQVFNKSYTLVAGANNINIQNIGNLISGAYIVSVTSSNTTQTGKFLKVN